ncbi:MAG: hypothetical protein WA001_00335 [Patescibacteria group bacterium]
MSRTILTDLGNVVVRFSFKRVAQNFHRLVPDTDVDALEKLLVDDERGLDLHERLETGFADPETYREGMSKLLGLPANVEPTIFWNCHCNLFTNNNPVIDLWRRACATDPELRLIAFSDCDPIRLGAVVRQTGLAFHRAVTSFRVGAWKPDAKMFKTALRVSECPPASIFYVDDKPDNVQAGTQHGFVSHRYDLDDPARDTLLQQAFNAFLAST